MVCYGDLGGGVRLLTREVGLPHRRQVLVVGGGRGRRIRVLRGEVGFFLWWWEGLVGVGTQRALGAQSGVAAYDRCVQGNEQLACTLTSLTCFSPPPPISFSLFCLSLPPPQKNTQMHITKNYLADQAAISKNVKVPLVLGIWGPKGCGKTFQVG